MKLALVVDDKLNLEIPKSSRFINVALCLVREKIAVTLLGIEPDRALADLEESGLKVVTIPALNPNASKWRIRLFDWGILPLVMAVRLIRINPDCVIIRGAWLGACLIPLMRLLRKTVAYDFHGYSYKEKFAVGKKWRAVFSRWQENLSLWGANMILTTNRGLKETEIPLKYHSKVLLLFNGVNMGEFRDALSGLEVDNIKEQYHICPTKKVVAFVGFWQFWIKLEDLLESASHLPQAQILIIGEAQNIKQLRCKYSQPNIIFTGALTHSQTIKLLKIVDVAVAPYKESAYVAKIDGFFSASRKITEYLAAGKPLVISDTKGKPVYLEMDENALFYKPGNPEDLARQVQRLIDNPALYKKISENNLKLAQEFSWENVIRNSGLMDILKR